MFLSSCTDNTDEIIIKERVIPKFETVGDKVSDGYYVGYMGDKKIESTFKDNKMIKRLVDGKEIDISDWDL